MASKSPYPWHPSGMKDIRERTAETGDIFYRAYGGASGMWGRSFFVPAIQTTDSYQLIKYWTAELLEKELSAALWGNAFEYLLTVRANNSMPPLEYKIGTVVQGEFTGVDQARAFTEQDFCTPSGIFKEVQFVTGSVEELKFCLDVVESARPIKSGRFSRQKSGFDDAGH